MLRDEENISLVFSDKKQLAVLGHILTSDKFFRFTKDILSPGWFGSGHAQRALTVAYNFYKKYNRVPTVDEIKNDPELIASGPEVRNQTVIVIDEAVLRQKFNYGLDVIGNELTSWLHSQIFFQAVKKAEKLYNNKGEEKAYVIVEDAVKEIRTSTFGNDTAEDFSRPMEDAEKQMGERSHALTTGLRVMDRLILERGPKDPEDMGALLPGDTTIVMAPSNTGKTTTAINIIRPNVILGHKVLFITHEGRPADIKKKIWCSFLNCSEIEYYALMETKRGQEKINYLSRVLQQNLTYMPMNKAGQKVEDVVAAIRRKQEELISNNNGKGFALVVNDYPALLSCESARNGILAKRNIDDIVYGNFVQLGLEYNFHVLAAIQVNREGAKINKNVHGDEKKPFLTQENVAESYGVMMQATNVITLNRDGDDKAKNRMAFYIDKSRSSDTGFAVVANTNFRHARTHDNELGCVWYRGSSSMSDRIDGFLQQFRDQQIPDSEVY